MQKFTRMMMAVLTVLAISACSALAWAGTHPAPPGPSPQNTYTGSDGSGG